MNYAIALSDEARAKLFQLPADIVGLLPDQFARLAAQPVTLSMPGAPPASLPDRQIYAFPADFSDGRRYTVRVHFRYGQDEMTLYVINITAILHAGPSLP
jgi:hypothetical protein